jgi:hypothetical protein
MNMVRIALLWADIEIPWPARFGLAPYTVSQQFNPNCAHHFTHQIGHNNNTASDPDSGTSDEGKNTQVSLCDYFKASGYHPCVGNFPWLLHMNSKNTQHFSKSQAKAH